MIDPSSEKLFPLDEIPPHLIPGRKGPAHIVTVHRWARFGVAGVRLETLKIGARRVTSAEALFRFFEAVTAAKEGAPQSTRGLVATQRTDRERARAVKAACLELERAGC